MLTVDVAVEVSGVSRPVALGVTAGAVVAGRVAQDDNHQRSLIYYNSRAVGTSSLVIVT